MSIECIVIGFNDEKMEAIVKRTGNYQERSASNNHMLSRSAICEGKYLKFSELVNRSISTSMGVQCDLSVYRMPNMAVHYLADYLNKRGVETARVNNFNHDKEKLKLLLKNERPLCVGISSTCQVDPVPIREVIEFIRRYNKDTRVIVGGPFINSINYEYTTAQKNFILRKIGADIYIHERQGQKALLEVCLALRDKNSNISLIPNIIFEKDRKYIHTEKRAENISLDEDPVKEMTFYPEYPKPSVYVQTALSCSLHCAFCRYPILGGDQMLMSLKSIEENFNYLKQCKVKYLVFIDDSLNIPLERFKAILKIMIKNKYNFKWFSFFRISHSDKETYELMKQSGCTGVILGVESGNNTILKNMDKQVTAEKLRWGIEQLHKNHIISYASVMIGFPGETEETVKDTINFIRETKPTFYDLQTWFYEKSVPIAKEKDYYRLEGYGYSWKHKDMDSLRASEIVSNTIQEISESRFMPSLSFNLWSLGYYLSQGAKVEEFFTFCDIFRKLINAKLTDVDAEYDSNMKKLMHVFENNTDLRANLSMRNLPEYIDK